MVNLRIYRGYFLPPVRVHRYTHLFEGLGSFSETKRIDAYYNQYTFHLLFAYLL